MRQQLNPKGSAKIIGNYSHGLKVDIGDSEMIFVTGQIAMDENGIAVAPDDIKKQTEYVFESIQRILNEAGSSCDDVVKAVIFVTRIGDFPLISPIRNKYFEKSRPVSTLVGINNTVKEGCDISIEVIALRKK